VRAALPAVVEQQDALAIAPLAGSDQIRDFPEQRALNAELVAGSLAQQAQQQLDGQTRGSAAVLRNAVPPGRGAIQPDPEAGYGFLARRSAAAALRESLTGAAAQSRDYQQARLPGGIRAQAGTRSAGLPEA
jgi:hypothetical protein